MAAPVAWNATATPLSCLPSVGARRCAAAGRVRGALRVCCSASDKDAGGAAPEPGGVDFLGPIGMSLGPIGLSLGASSERGSAAGDEDGQGQAERLGSLSTEEWQRKYVRPGAFRGSLPPPCDETVAGPLLVALRRLPACSRASAHLVDRD
jgi:hypothetical protein